SKEIIEVINLLSDLKGIDLPIELENLQEFQNSIGAGFHGFVPDTYNKDLNINPIYEFNSILENAKILLKRKSEIKTQFSHTDFPLEFWSEKPTLEEESINNNIISKINVNIDYRAIEILLKILKNKSNSQELIDKMVKLDSITEMLKHRKDLGFIPEPMMDQNGLKSLLNKIAEDFPINKLWCWLNPWNFFNIADYETNFEDFEILINYLSANLEKITSFVRMKLEKFVPDTLNISETFAITFEWGIRGWVTDKMSGCNLEFFKDDIEGLIRTITHELYHRIQLKVFQDLLNIKDVDNIEDLIIKREIGTKKDNKFYEALAYIFAEGTATFVSGMGGKMIELNNIKEGFNLLNSIYNKIYDEDDLEKVEELINKGMISNGPFYSVGYYMSKMVVDNFGKNGRYPELIKGVLYFFRLYISLFEEPKLIQPKFKLNDRIQKTILKFHNNLN
ncbi:MAG: hypothetical protein P8Y97_17255, partial [Candidatus Lokiarchaeota archaeon]